MIITMKQAEMGLMKYMDTEIIPHLTGLKRIGLGIYAALAADNAVAMAMQYKNHPAVSVLGVVDADGNIDIEKLYAAVSPMFADGSKQTITIPVINETFHIDKTDIEKIYQYMKEA